MLNKLPPPDQPRNVPHNPFTRTCLQILERPLKLIDRLTALATVFDLHNVSYTGEKAANLILQKFTEAFSRDVIPYGDNEGVVAYLILPNLAKSFPKNAWISFLPQFIVDKSPKFKRQLLYSLLSLYDIGGDGSSISDVSSFLKVIVLLLPGIDSQ